MNPEQDYNETVSMQDDARIELSMSCCGKSVSTTQGVIICKNCPDEQKFERRVFYDDGNNFKPINLSAIKADDSKLPLDLLDPLALEGIAAVLAFGAKKYAAHNWRGGFKWSRLIAALLRHTFAIMKGELLDPESNLPHIDHIGCCWMFLSNHMKSGIGENDLYFNGSQKSETGKV